MNTKLTRVLNFFFLFLFFSVYSDETVNFSLEGHERKYLLHTPVNKNQGPLPLVLVLHGAGGNAEMTASRYGWLEKADKKGFVVAFPEATPINPALPANFMTNPNVWNDGSGRGKKRVNDIAYLKKVIEDISSKTSIDPKRIYITGFSNGASMTFLAGIKLSDLVSAIAPVSGHLWTSDKPKKLVSVLLIAGGKDPLNPLEGGMGKNPWKKEGEMKPPMIQSITEWLHLMGKEQLPKKEEVEQGVTRTTYGPDKDGFEAIFIVIPGEGHEWPGGKRALPEKITGPSVNILNATDTIWDFFNRH